MPEQQTKPAAPPAPGLLPAIDWLWKIFAAAIALMTALGAPAVAIQMVRLSIPSSAAGAIWDVLISSLERGMALRAGALPAIFLLIMGYGVHKLAIYNIHAEIRTNLDGAHPKLKRDLSITAFAVLFVVLLEAILLLIAVVYAITGAISIGSGIIKRPYFLLIGLGVLAGVSLLIRLAQFATKGRVAKIFFTAYMAVGQKGNSLGQGQNPWSIIVFSLILCVTGFLCGASFSLIDRFIWKTHITESAAAWNSILDASLACLFGALVPFLTDVAWNTSEIIISPWYKRPLWIAAVVYFYVPVVLVWSIKWYPAIPYAVGGGKPAASLVWVDAKKFPTARQSLLPRVRPVLDSDSFLLENGFLVYASSDTIILADGDDPYAHGALLPRSSIYAIASRR